MRLAVFTSKYPALVATFFERDMRSLIEAGVDIEIFPIYPLENDLWQYTLDLLGPDVLPRHKIHHLGLPSAVGSLRPWPVQQAGRFAADTARIATSAMRYGLGPLGKSLYVMPKAWAWARQYANQFDHVLAYWGNYAGSCAYAFHRLTNPRVPFSMWLHAGTDLYFRPVYLEEKIAYADRIITCCAFNHQYLNKRFPRLAPDIDHKLHVSYHGLDLDDLSYEANGRPARRLIAVGRFARDKGFGDLVHATHLLRQQGIDVELQLVGNGPEASNLRALAVDLGVSDLVNFRGWLPFNEVPKAMRDATILVHPSTGLGDGLPNVIREAMAVGTPVIASHIAGIPEALDGGRCGVLVPPRNTNELANAIGALLADSPRQRELARRARVRTEEKFDMWRNGQELADVLRQTSRRTAPADAPVFLPAGAPARRS
jgi:glycosyltransferase involved in cell wall biosynthesis